MDILCSIILITSVSLKLLPNIKGWCVCTHTYASPQYFASEFGKQCLLFKYYCENKTSSYYHLIFLQLTQRMNSLTEAKESLTKSKVLNASRLPQFNVQEQILLLPGIIV